MNQKKIYDNNSAKHFRKESEKIIESIIKFLDNDFNNHVEKMKNISNDYAKLHENEKNGVGGANE